MEYKLFDREIESFNVIRFSGNVYEVNCIAMKMLRNNNKCSYYIRTFGILGFIINMYGDN